MLQQCHLRSWGLILPFTNTCIFFQDGSDFLCTLDPAVRILGLIGPLPGVFSVYSRICGGVGAVFSHFRRES